MKGIIIAVLLLGAHLAALGQTTYTWNGSASTTWINAANWTPFGIPLPGDNIVIVAAARVPQLPANASCSNFTLTSGSLNLGGFTLTANGNAVFTAGTILNGTMSVPSATTATFGSGPVIMNCATNVTAGSLLIRNTTFQGTTTLNKTGASNDGGYGQNTFNGVTTITNSGTGYWLSCNNAADTYNNNVTFTSTNGRIIPVQNGSGSQFNGNITVNCTSATGSVEIGNSSGTSTLAATSVITVGVSGFTAGILELNKIIQAAGGVNQTFAVGSAATLKVTACTFTGNATLSGGRMDIDNNTWNKVVSLTKLGTSTDACGGNTFTGATTLTNAGTDEWHWGATTADTYATNLTINNSGTSHFRLANSSAGNQFNGPVVINNNGSGASNNIYISESAGSAAVFNSTVTCNNTSTATTTLIRFNLSGTNTFAENIVVNSTAAGNGIYFGWPTYTGTATLANTKTITTSTGISGGGVSFYNFTQTGTTPQLLTCTGTSIMNIGPGTVFNGNVNFTSSRIRLDGATYNGTATFTKTGASDDAGDGGNTFASTTTMINAATSTGYFMTGSGSRDVFNGNFNVTNASVVNQHIAYNHPGQTTTIAGNLTVNNSGASGEVYFMGANAASNLTVAGTTTITNSLAGTAIHFNSGIGSTATFTGDVTIDNLGTASRVYMSRRGTTNFNGNIFVGSASSTAISFGDLNGTATLATTKTISASPSGFVSGRLDLSNFTQLGSTAQSITFSGTASAFNIGPNATFNAPLTINAPSITTRASLFNSTTSFTKTGTPTDNAYGGNTFVGASVIVNSGSGPFRFADTAPDAFSSTVNASNSGTSYLELAYATAGNTFAGDVILNNSAGGASEISVCKGANATAVINGNLTVGLSGGGTTNTGYLAQGNGSALTINGNLTVTNTGVGTGSNDVYLATSGNLTVGGTSSFTNNGSGTNSRIFIGETSTTSIITFGGDATFINNSTPSNDGYIRVVRGTIAFNGNILVGNNSTAPNDNGIFLCWPGAFAGNATLANTKTIGVSGPFTTGTLSLVRFKQLGTTNQALTLTNTASLVSGPGSSFGATSLNFSSASIYLNGATYAGTTTFTKTGATTNSSTGGNTFTGVVTLVNSGSGTMRLANSSPDIFTTHVIGNNTGTSSLQLAFNSTGNVFGGNVTLTSTTTGASSLMSIVENDNATATITGTLTATSTSTATDNSIRLAQGPGTTLAIGGALNINNTATGTNDNYVYVSQAGSVTVTGNSIITNASSGTNSAIFVSQNATGAFTSGGNFTINHGGTANSNECYLANAGALAVTGATDINNSGSGATSYVRICEGATTSTAIFTGTFTATGTSNATNSLIRVLRGTATFNNNMVLNNTASSTGTFNGFYIGLAGFAGNGTLASGRTVTVGGVGFTTGNLQLANFTQLGNTAQNFVLTGTSRLTLGLSALPATFNGDVTFSVPGGTATLTSSVFQRNVTGTAQGIIATNNAFNVGTGLTTLTNNASSAGTFDSGGNTFLGATTLTNNGLTGSVARWGQTGGDVFASTLLINATGPASTSLSRTTGTSTFAGNISINSPTTGVVAFGFSGGNAVLASGVSISTIGTASGNVSIYRMTQNGTATNTLNVGGAGTLTLGTTGNGNTFGGALNFTCASTTILNANTFADVTGSGSSLQLLGNIFNGVTTLTKNGSANDDTNGGNVYNGSTTLTVSSIGRWRLGSSSSDDYNGNISFLQSSTGALQPAYTNASTFAGDISTTGSGSAITFGSNGGRVIIDGTLAQSWSGDVIRKPLLTRLTMQSTGALTLAVPIDVSTDLTLVSGVINTTTLNVLSLTDETVTVTNTTISGNSFVDGPMNYISSTGAANTALFFPLGDGTVSRPITVYHSHTNGTAVTYTAEDFTGSAATLGFTLPSTIERISGARYYKVDRGSVTNLTNARIKIIYGTDDQVSDFANLKVAKSTSSSSPWIDIGGTATGNGTGEITSGTFTSFSYFSLANGVGGTNPLPVELLFFKALLNDENNVTLNWATAIEKRNDFFTIERSSDGMTFETVTTKDGAGDSNERLDYATVDTQPFAGLSYYRLMQTDFDGRHTYSNLAAVTREVAFSIYPNPSSDGRFFVQLPASDNIVTAKVSLTTALGHEVYASEVLVDKTGVITVGNNSLSSGVYLISLEVGNLKFHRRLIIE